jgi:glucose/arabinose dehydrogenase
MAPHRLRLLWLAAIWLCATAYAQTNPITTGAVSIKLNKLATINTGADGTPQDLVSANDGSGRMFVATRNGKIRIMSPGGAIGSTAFLDMASAGLSIYTGGEGGLLDVAFSPDYATSGKFYTFTTEPFLTTGPAADYSHPELFPTTSTNPNNQIVIREWTANAANPNLANASSRVLLRLNHPQSNHQGGGLRFGPDGDLYVSLGDGGGGNDNNGNATTPNDGHTNNLGNGQDTTVPFGKILRIDPKGTNSTNHQYGIPADNPFASGVGGLKEIYAYGLRNPFRISFDRVNGTLYAGDVGQGSREEVDVITKGGNYGWVFREGTRDNSGSYGASPPPGFSSIAPIAEYTHSDGIAIIGGNAYHGTIDPALVGKYVFGELGGPTGSTGRLFYTSSSGGVINEFGYLPGSYTIPTGANLYGLGEDANGELYAYFSNGDIVQVAPEPIFWPVILGVAALARRRRGVTIGG